MHATSAHRATDNRIFHKECCSLRGCGFDVHLAAMAESDYVQQGVRIHALPIELSRVRRAVLGNIRIWRIARRVRPHLLHVHDPELIPLAVLWMVVHGGPAVYDAHESLARSVVDKTYLPVAARRAVTVLARVLELAAGRWLSLIVAATPAIARDYPNEKVAVVQNFPWLSSFPPPTTIASDCASNYVYVGGLSRERGAFEMIAAFRLLNLDSPATLTVAGPVTPEVEVLLAEERAVVNYVGNRPVSEVPGLISRSLAGLSLFSPLANHIESQPTKIFEYMAAGRPFIASDFPHWRRLLGDYDCALFVDPEDPEAIASALEALASDLTRAAAMGRRGRAVLEAHFTFEAEAAVLRDAVVGLVS